MEGIEFVEFNGKKITSAVAKGNFAFWRKKDSIPEKLTDEYHEVLKDVRKLHGAHTFALKVNSESGVIYPLLKIFSFNEAAGKFENKNCGVICDKIRKGDGAHMSLARKIGLDKYVFSYLGMHLPYHRLDDMPPIFPFGLFVKPSAFARMHGSPCDRDYEHNDEVDKENVDKYFLLPEDLQVLVTNRVLKDPFFSGKFWKYHGNPDDWEDEMYRNNQWKKKAEYCHFEKLNPEDIEAVLWPVWESTIDENAFSPDDLYELIPSFEESFGIKVILYRPYGELIEKESWMTKNMRDWEIALVEASYLAHRYFIEHTTFPDSIKEAREYFNSKVE